MLGSSVPPVVCRRVNALFRMLGSSVPPVVCRMVHVLFRMLGLSVPLNNTVICERRT
jgi:hypothetical protein